MFGIRRTSPLAYVGIVCVYLQNCGCASAATLRNTSACSSCGAFKQQHMEIRALQFVPSVAR